MAKRQANRIAAAQAYYARVQTLPQTGQAQRAQAPAANIKNDDDQEERRKSARKQPQRKKAPDRALLDAADSDHTEDAAGVEEAADSDEIVVASKPKSGQSKAKSKSRPAQSTGKKSGGKRKASSSVSSSPLSKRNKTGTTSRAPRKSAPTTGLINSLLRDWDGVEDDGDDDDDEDDMDEMPLQQASRRRGAASSQRNISCRCPGKSPTPRDCFKCRDCGMHQHYGCADDSQDGLSVMCNFCFSRPPMQSPQRPQLTFQPPPPVFTQPPKPQPQPPKPAPPPAPATAQQMVQPAPQYDPALRDEVNHLCSTVLWREYCSIPFPDEEEPPTQNPGPAPQDWLSDCQDRLMNLLTAAGQQQTSTYLAPALVAWPRQSHQIMKALRELALEEIFRGSYKGKRKQLGVVLEVLGLEEKGTIWKGGRA